MSLSFENFILQILLNTAQLAKTEAHSNNYIFALLNCNFQTAPKTTEGLTALKNKIPNSALCSL